MNADLNGLLAYMKANKNKNLQGIIVSDNGETFSNQKTRAYVEWCVKNGYKFLHDAPDIKTVLKQTIKEKDNEIRIFATDATEARRPT